MVTSGRFADPEGLTRLARGKRRRSAAPGKRINKYGLRRSPGLPWKPHSDGSGKQNPGGESGDLIFSGVAVDAGAGEGESEGSVLVSEIKQAGEGFGVGFALKGDQGVFGGGRVLTGIEGNPVAFPQGGVPVQIKAFPGVGNSLDALFRVPEKLIAFEFDALHPANLIAVDEPIAFVADAEVFVNGRAVEGSGLLSGEGENDAVGQAGGQIHRHGLVTTIAVTEIQTFYFLLFVGFALSGGGRIRYKPGDMKFYSAHSMRCLDEETISAGISGRCLMGRACLALAEEFLFFAGDHPQSAVILCGPGNNGGDGFGLAWQLHRRGWTVEAWSVIPGEKVKGDAAFFMGEARSAGVRIRYLTEEADWRDAETFLPVGSWWVDALLGTGATEAPRGAVASAVRFLLAMQPQHRIWAVDLPSGLHPDTGEPFDAACCVRADHTLTLGGAKCGFEKDRSAVWTGSVSVLELGFDSEKLDEKGEGDWRVLSRNQAADWLPPLMESDHKGSRGHALLIGGSPGMSGAILLAARAALRSGCGLVTVLTPFTCAQLVDGAQAELMVIPGQQGQFHTLCGQNISYSVYSGVCIGPGMRVNRDTAELLTRVLAECQVPLVVDADGLNALSGIERNIGHLLRGRWLTPHPGEMGRLLKANVADIQRDRRSKVQEFHHQTGSRIVLKGSRSRIAQADGDCWVNLNGNPGMATAGTGDVLTGILTGLLARGVEHSRALPLAVYMHGRAGDLAAVRMGQSGMCAGDVVDAIPAVLRQLQGR